MDPEAIQLLRELRDDVREIRDETRQTNARLDQANARLDQTNARLDQANARLEVVETTVLDLAEQQRFVVRYLRTLTARDRSFDDDLRELKRRVEEIEARLGPV
jgi:chromosome segregation ATPase